MSDEDREKPIGSDLEAAAEYMPHEAQMVVKEWLANWRSMNPDLFKRLADKL